MVHTGTNWERAKSHLKAGEMMVDGLPAPGVLSSRPIGLGQDRLKWEIPGIIDSGRFTRHENNTGSH